MNVRDLARRALAARYIWAVVAILILLAVNLVRDPGYLAISVNPVTENLSGNLLDILRNAAPILMIAVGMCLVISTDGTPSAALTAIALALLVSTVIGVVNGFLVAVVGLQPFITTLVMMLAGRGIAKVITSGQNTTARNETFRWIANGHVLGFPVVILLALAVVLVVGLVVRRTALGLMIESIGINARASRMVGIKPRGLLITVYSVSGLLAGIAGLFTVSTVMTVDVSQTGSAMEMDAILAVVIGGTALAGGKFSLTGAVAGAFLIATLNKTVVFLGVPSSATPAFKAVVIIVICLIQSERVRGYVSSRRRVRTTPAQERVA